MSLHLGIELDGEGAHPEAWRRAGHSPDRLLTGRTVADRVAAAENAGFTFATFEDSLLPPGADGGPVGRIDAVNRAAFVAATTSTLGLVPVVGTTYAEPFHTSSQLATLDYASRGRGGWIASRDTDPRVASALGRSAVTVPADLAREERDAITVVRDLWDSWEDDAVIRDYATGRFVDRDRLHYIDFQGDTYSVKGPAIVPRPPQGQLVVFGRGGEVDPSQVDVVLVSEATLDDIADAAARTKDRGAALVFVELDVALGSSTPAPPSGRLSFAGEASGLLELLRALDPHVDGVRLHPAVVDHDLPVLARYVVPALLREGLAHRPVTGATLRGTLGLARPDTRFQAPRLEDSPR
ncbi:MULTISPECIES: LLM class flavin-dependent oxidoreductase [unclassified Rhodococcus (in: high G+C Gram-positive bacteria)]|uniref:LLM class flavin-dependent oxidoreductase n=1 Tax=unclassified Rhodococcus (in: high G+C Gram-positive bacteria) TaxID=192944 RepID=UPI00163AEED4|nr:MULTISPECIES: LLM class flavin-dependent oxidoreductase [unclassified Rhodococcus (in: high G+C Gram-positive bacteria)]MBC2639616.1 LLM class flavin-dependent oxidoreductase [Rhodococcus sp. 3A]MBC2895638.1 LLM class flavin-dependent oxidoreductase [Rhodococcus sp. 4CII]